MDCLWADPSLSYRSHFVFLIHRRVAPRIYRMMKELEEYWGQKSPFVIIENNLSAILERSSLWERLFQIRLDKGELVLVRRGCPPWIELCLLELLHQREIVGVGSSILAFLTTAYGRPDSGIPRGRR